jgi:hypothetical protein
VNPSAADGNAAMMAAAARVGIAPTEPFAVMGPARTARPRATTRNAARTVAAEVAAFAPMARVAHPMACAQRLALLNVLAKAAVRMVVGVRAVRAALARNVRTVCAGERAFPVAAL